MRRVKIAQIGTSSNSHGNNIFEALKQNDDLFEIVGYVFPENEREKFPERMPAFEGYRELTLEEVLNTPEIEAVAVETEEIYLSKYALMVAKSKKHIHMEKPGGLVLSDFEKLIDTVKKNKTVFHTGYMYRYNPYVIELKNQIKNGELGDIISIEAQMSAANPKNVREWLGTFKGGMMFYLGCHLIDLIISIQGKPKNIIPLNKRTGADGVCAEDFGMAVLEYENGVSFAKTSALEIGGFERRQLVVTGTKKTVELRPLEWFLKSGLQYTTRHSYESADWLTRSEKQESEHFHRYNAMMRAFGEMVIGEKENPFGYDYELELYKTVLMACNNI